MPKKTKGERLEKLVRDYIEEHRISCADAIYQSDSVNLSATVLVEELCKVVGWYEDEEE